MKILIIAISILMIAGSVAVLTMKSLKNAAIVMGVVSLLAAAFFVVMKAYDVAITEAAIGAVLTTALYFFAIRRLDEDSEKGDAK